MGHMVFGTPTIIALMHYHMWLLLIVAMCVQCEQHTVCVILCKPRGCLSFARAQQRIGDPPPPSPIERFSLREPNGLRAFKLGGDASGAINPPPSCVGVLSAGSTASGARTSMVPPGGLHGSSSTPLVEYVFRDHTHIGSGHKTAPEGVARTVRAPCKVSIYVFSWALFSPRFQAQRHQVMVQWAALSCL